MSSTGSRRPTVTRPRIPDVETVPSALRRAADLHGDVEAVVDRDAWLTYVQLRREVEDVSAALFARDMRSGDVVAIWAPNSSRWALTALACMNVGITLVPVNTRYKAEEADAVPIDLTLGAALAMAMVAVLVAFLYQRSSAGLRLRAVRDDEPAAAPSGST